MEIKKNTNNLVIGVYCGYGSNIIIHKGGLYFFLKSLRKVNTDCKVVILCRLQDMFPELINFCKDMNAELIPCIPNELIHAHMFQRYRFKQIYTFLLENKDNRETYEKILMSDLADVIFQEDPFSFEISGGIYPATEQSILSDKNNSSSKLNMEWIHEYSFLNMDYTCFDNKYIICCGTIIGNNDAILKYLDFYTHVNANFYNDQAVINIYIYHHMRDKINTEKYTESKILTLDKIKFEDLDINEKGQIINKQKQIYSIIHQIDRCNLSYMKKLVENN
jgi:hypothetical protein